LICPKVMFVLCSELSVFSSGASAVTVIVSEDDPSFREISIASTVATWTRIPVCTYLLNPDAVTFNS
jgi:hypothetical protein